MATLRPSENTHLNTLVYHLHLTQSTNTLPRRPRNWPVAQIAIAANALSGFCPLCYTHISDHYISRNRKYFCLFCLYDIKRLERMQIQYDDYITLFVLGMMKQMYLRLFILFLFYFFICFDDCNIYQNKYCSNPKHKGCLFQDNF